MTKRLICFSIAALLVMSCQKHGEPGFAEGKQTFRELLALRDQIAKEFHENVSDVSIADNTRMTVKFVNSPFNSRTQEEKQKRADEVAQFVVKNYKQPLTSVSLQFVTEGASAETYVGRTDSP